MCLATGKTANSLIEELPAGARKIFKPLFGASGSPSNSAAKKVLTRGERLSMFKNDLSKAANVSSPDEAISLINKTMDNIELKHAGATDRMFGILDEMFVTRHNNGTVTALTKGHRIEIKSNGSFEIFNRTTGELFFKK